MRSAYQLSSDFDSSCDSGLEDLERLIRMGETANPDLIDAYIDMVLELASNEDKQDVKNQVGWLLRLQTHLFEGAFNQSVSESQRSYFLQSLYQLFFILKPLNVSDKPCYYFQCLSSKWMTLRHYLV